jgi:hypothetical protein
VLDEVVGVGEGVVWLSSPPPEPLGRGVGDGGLVRCVLGDVVGVGVGVGARVVGVLPPPDALVPVGAVDAAPDGRGVGPDVPATAWEVAACEAVDDVGSIEAAGAGADGVEDGAEVTPGDTTPGTAGTTGPPGLVDDVRVCTTPAAAPVTTTPATTAATLRPRPTCTAVAACAPAPLTAAWLTTACAPAPATTGTAAIGPRNAESAGDGAGRT